MAKSIIKKQIGGYDKSLYQTPIYRSWYNMKTRCSNSNSPEYARYGARGITFDSKWSTFKGFLTDMGFSYKEGLSIDRIDNNGDYCKENCRWSTDKEQSRNRRTSRYIKFKGETKTLAEWIEESGVKSSTFRQRFYVYKWPFSQCLNYKN